MDPKFQTSFIPKKPLIQTSSPRPARTTSLFTIISMIIFITVLALAGGAWGYKMYLSKHNDALALELNNQLKRFEPKLIAPLSQLDARIESSKILLKNHVALTSLFDFLSQVTLKNVRFSTFAYTLTASKVSLSMNGEAQSFSDIALQARELQSAQNAVYIQNPQFSNLNLDEAGNVKFDFTATMDANKILYKNYVNNLAQNQSAVTTQ